MHLYSISRYEYSGTSEERILWEQHFSPFFRGCPYLEFHIIFYIMGWNISNVVKFVYELVCKIVM